MTSKIIGASLVPEDPRGMERSVLEARYIEATQRAAEAGQSVIRLQSKLAAAEDIRRRLQAVPPSRRSKRSIRRSGEHWYRLAAAFDPEAATAWALPGAPPGSYLMGVLDEVIVVSVPRETPPEMYRSFQAAMRAQGMTSVCLVVPEGVEFLRLDAVVAADEKKLDADYRAARAAGVSENDAGAIEIDGPDPTEAEETAAPTSEEE